MVVMTRKILVNQITKKQRTQLKLYRVCTQRMLVRSEDEKDSEHKMCLDL